MQKSSALSFKDLKQRISIEQVLRHYNLFETLQLKGKSHRGSCPFCEAKEGSPFSVSLEKNCFQCFSCHVSGNILDVVIKLEGITLREAGQLLNRTFVDGTASHEPAKIIQQQAPPVVEAGEADEKVPSAIAPSVAVSDGQNNEVPIRNEPLTFALKHIEADHPSVKALGIREDIVTAFGVGYYRGRGMMGNRIVFPIYNPGRQLVAYAGFHPEEYTYTYPPKFRTELELYNLKGARASLDDSQDLLVVRHPLEVLMLISCGYLNAIATMGESISTEQVEMLLAHYGAGEKLTLFWSTQTDVVPPLVVLFPHFFVRLRRYECRENTPAGFTADEVRELLA
jgi:DNA primase